MGSSSDYAIGDGKFLCNSSGAHDCDSGTSTRRDVISGFIFSAIHLRRFISLSRFTQMTRDDKFPFLFAKNSALMNS